MIWYHLGMWFFYIFVSIREHWGEHNNNNNNHNENKNNLKIIFIGIVRTRTHLNELQIFIQYILYIK